MDPAWLKILIVSSFGVSLVVPFVLVSLPPRSARRLLRWAFLAIIPTLAIRCGTMMSEGDRGFLGPAHLIGTSAFLLMVSCGFGYGLTLARSAWLSRRGAAQLKAIDPEL